VIDAEKLAALRVKYGVEAGATIYDPHFRTVANRLFTGQRRALPYTTPATFLDLPLRPEAAADGGGLDIAFIGVPMDLGVTNRAGARLGPGAVRAIERIGPYEHVLRTVPMAQCKAADIGDVVFQSRFSLEHSHADIESAIDRLASAGVVPISVGGDHSMTYPILRVVGRERPVGLVHIDAHCDTSGAFEGSKFHHGGPFRQAVLDGVLDPERTVQIGIRGSAEWLWEFSYETGMTVIHAEEVAEMGISAVIAKARAVVGDGPVYITFDIDSLDPGFAPGTGTPEVGGLAPREVMTLLRGLVGIDVVGGDVVEVAPPYDATSNTAQAGAQMLFEIFALAAAALIKRRAG
jgi:guanidinopropionase